MFARHSLLRNLSAAVVLLGGCNNSQGPLPPPDVQAPIVTLSPSDAIITEGQTIQLTVTVTDADGNQLSAADVRWSTSNQDVAPLVGPGKVQGQQAGTAVIAATWEGASDQAVLNVRPRSRCAPLLRTDQSAAPCPVQ
jgi:hypothetical protein